MTETSADVAVERLYAAAKETMHQPDAEFLAATIRAHIADLQSQLAAQRERDGRDAARWRWVATHFRSMPKMSGNHQWFMRSFGHLRGPTLEEAIDAALKDRP